MTTQQQALRGAIQGLFPGKDVLCHIPARNLATGTSEVVCVLIKPFKNKVEIARVSQDTALFLPHQHSGGGLATQKTWRLRELAEFDELPDEPGVCENGFVLRFSDKQPMRWAAQSRAERMDLLATVFRVCQAHLRDMPRTALDPSTLPTAEDSAAAAGGHRSREDALMTEAEERELVETLGPDVVGDFDAVYARLASKLFALETSNVQDLMNARGAVDEILAAESRSTAALLTEMREWLQQYEEPLKSMRQYIEHIEETNNRMEVATKNQRVLLATLQDLLERLSLDSSRGPIERADFANPDALPELVAAANRLKDIVGTELQPELAKMAAVREQVESARKLLFDFARKLTKFLCDLFLRLEGKMTEKKKTPSTVSSAGAGAGGASAPVLAGIGMAVRLLEPFVPLVVWLKEVDPASHKSVTRAYVAVFSRVYRKCIHDFFDAVRAATVKEPKERREKLAAILFSSSSKKVDAEWLRIVKQSAPLQETAFTADKAFGHAFLSVVKATRAECEWCSLFLGLQKSSAKEMEAFLHELLGEFRTDLVELMTIACKADPFYMLSALIELDEYVDDSCGFIQHETTALQSECKRLFNHFIDSQVEQINTTQIPIRRFGVAAHAIRFPYFVDYAEESGTGRAAALSLDKMDKACSALSTVTDIAYTKLSVALFSWIASIPNPHPSKKFTYIIRIENLGHLKREIARRRVRCLQQYAKEASDRYDRAIAGLAEFLLEKSFGKLLEFFTQVKVMTASMPADEVQFKSSYSKQACLALVGKYGAATIEHAFVEILKNLEKNVSQESGLLAEVWDAVTGVFLSKYARIEELMASCYSGKMPVSGADAKGIIAGVWEKHRGAVSEAAAAAASAQQQQQHHHHHHLHLHRK